MKRSLKLKITLWFAVSFFIISLIAMIALYGVSKNILFSDQRANIQATVKEFSKKLSVRDDVLTVSPGAHLYERGVHRIVYDTQGNILQGELPAALAQMPIVFTDGQVREHNTKNCFYLEYDMSLTLDGETYWIKGIAVLDDEMRIINPIIQRGILLILALVIAASVGAYIVVWRVFQPVEKIRKTAADIAESNDLSRRIQIGDDKDEIHALANTFDEMLDRIEQTLIREKQFTSDASHELRTPIAVILSECDYAKSCAKTSEEYSESLDAISRQADRMQKLVSELLTISRMDNHTIKAEFEETDISELLTFVCDEQEEIQSPNIIMERQIPPGITAKADRDLLARLFINLITNAYQYSHENGRIEVFLEEIDGKVVFTLKDYGIGIAENELPLIWNRFYRGDASRSVNEHNSLGLGLSMVKWIAECHGGNVTVSSEIGKGSEFEFIFPKEF